MVRVLYPGSFDPMTKGHMNVVDQASDIFDEVVVAVMQNPDKPNGFFTLEERMEIIKHLAERWNNVKVILGSGAVVDVAVLNECKAILRGLRDMSDYTAENRAQMFNRKISNDQVKTICLFCDSRYEDVSSSAAKIAFNLGKDPTAYVEPYVYEKMKEKRGM